MAYYYHTLLMRVDTVSEGRRSQSEIPAVFNFVGKYLDIVLTADGRGIRRV